jgi:hypothetical protein
MKIELKVGETYINREGVEMKVMEKLPTNEFIVQNDKGIYCVKDFYDYGNGYIVNLSGGFGEYPNHRDLIKIK